MGRDSGRRTGSSESEAGGLASAIFLGEAIRRALPQATHVELFKTDLELFSCVPTVTRSETANRRTII